MIIFYSEKTFINRIATNGVKRFGPSHARSMIHWSTQYKIFLFNFSNKWISSKVAILIKMNHCTTHNIILWMGVEEIDFGFKTMRQRDVIAVHTGNILGVS